MFEEGRNLIFEGRNIIFKTYKKIQKDSRTTATANETNIIENNG
jgi:hypothetical protein